MVVCVTAALLRWRAPRSVRQLWRVGGSWAAATLAFEFGFGRLVQRKSWPDLLAAYTFDDGNLWPLVLVALLLAPPAIGRALIRTGPGAEAK